MRDMPGPIAALFSDVDGTMTSGEWIEAETWVALDRLAAAGVPVIMVTGRSAGFGHAALRMSAIPVVIAENGGVVFVRRGRAIEKQYAVPVATIPEWRKRMMAALDAAASEIPGLQLSSDSRYREVDLAVDWNEEVALPRDAADRCVVRLREAGFTATRSSVHVNFGPPMFDKLSACLGVIRNVLGGDVGELARYVYVGDSLNDAPMFGGFPNSVGVANIRDAWHELEFRPAFVTEQPEGAGLREVIDHVLAVR